jgi:ribulose-phosphate 3-epimerase
MLSADPTKLGQELLDVVRAGAECIHWDIMDGHFVDAITFGAHVVSAHRSKTSARFDVHLMVEHPDKYLRDFADAGADVIIVHPESCIDLQSTLLIVKDLNKKVGIAINPGTPLDSLKHYANIIDMVLVMTVNPGKAGQAFMQSQLPKISMLKKMLPENVGIYVDGGINDETSAKCIVSGADGLISGSFLFKSKNYTEVIATIRKQ